MDSNLKENLPSIVFLLLVGSITLIPILVPSISTPFAVWIQENVNSFGVWGPIVMVLFMILATIFSPIPNSLITLAMGATYGPVWGTILAIIGAALASSLAFWLARMFGEKLVERFFPKTHFIHQFITNNAFATIFVLRLIPSVSFDMISYGVGLTAVPFRTFAVATLLGIIPGTISIVLVGAGLTHDNNLSIIGGVIYGALVLVGLFLSSRFHVGQIKEAEKEAKKPPLQEKKK